MLFKLCQRNITFSMSDYLSIHYIEFYGKPSNMGITYKGWKFVNI